MFVASLLCENSSINTVTALAHLVTHKHFINAYIFPFILSIQSKSSTLQHPYSYVPSLRWFDYAQKRFFVDVSWICSRAFRHKTCSTNHCSVLVLTPQYLVTIDPSNGHVTSKYVMSSIAYVSWDKNSEHLFRIVFKNKYTVNNLIHYQRTMVHINHMSALHRRSCARVVHCVRIG